MDSIDIWHVDIQYQNTGQVQFLLQYTNFLRSYGPFIKT